MSHQEATAVIVALAYLRRVVAKGPYEEAELLSAVRTLERMVATPVTAR